MERCRSGSAPTRRLSSEPVDAVRLERCRAHAEWIAERAQGAVAQRAAALLKTLSEGGGKGEAEEARRRFEELAEGCAQGHDTPYIGAAWVGQNAYLEIVAMGEAALPMLLERVRTEPREWLPALEAITGQRWEAEDAAFEDRVRFWREWGREQGYLSPRSGDGNSNGE